MNDRILTPIQKVIAGVPQMDTMALDFINEMRRAELVFDQYIENDEMIDKYPMLVEQCANVYIRQRGIVIGMLMEMYSGLFWRNEMIKTAVRSVSYKMLDIWIENEDVRQNVRDWIEENGDTANVGEMEIPVDDLIDITNKASYVHLGDKEIVAIGYILGAMSRNADIMGVTFAKKEGDVTP